MAMGMEEAPTQNSGEENSGETRVSTVGSETFSFRRILVPLDGSEHSVKALETAVQIALKFGSRIMLVHVYQVGGFAISPTPVEEFIEAIRKMGVSILEDGEKRVKSGGVKVEKLLLEGRPVDQIIRTCREGGFDMIVMGARGLSRVREILLGSVSDGVVRHASCPVLVVK
ncbi:MAG: universal stress protein [Candidatus Brockarchaeota archaeon]|nr:universal stress protein [Candidatus Brockarchaeota archaeon]MBO3808421.1 universal stress protein [Candidatus Brockarchaeota archaeon]